MTLARVAILGSSLASAAFAAEPTTAPSAEAGAPVVDLWPTSRPVATTRPEWTFERKIVDGRRDRVVHDVDHPTLTVFLPEPRPQAPAIAVVICPGGGYGGQVIDKEGYDVARRLNASGIAAFVLRYRLPGGIAPTGDDALPLPLEDARRAMRVVRARAGEWGVDPARVGIVGFSAGGHLAGSVACGIGGDARDDVGDAASDQSARPAFAGLLYPVVSMRDGLTHAGSRRNLLGEDASAAGIERFSLESRVADGATPPLFVAHAGDDRAVPVAATAQLVTNAMAGKVPVHAEFYTAGGHGFGTGVRGGEATGWPERFVGWLRQISASPMVGAARR